MRTPATFVLVTILVATGVGVSLIAPSLSAKLTTSSSTPLCPSPILGGLKLAAVVPTFTATAYSNHSFYSFYALHSSDPPGTRITSDVTILSRPLSLGLANHGGWGSSFTVAQFLKSNAAKSCGVTDNMALIQDRDVASVPLGRYDAILLSHSEYATQDEYTHLMDYVASGGRLVMVDADALNVNVTYSGGQVTYVQGHGFTLNGKVAVRDGALPFQSSNANWVGSAYCCTWGILRGAVVNSSDSIGGLYASKFGLNLLPQYTGHEENALLNLTGTSVVASWRVFGNATIAAYVHQYKAGSVFCSSIIGDDEITYDPGFQYLIVLALRGYD